MKIIRRIDCGPSFGLRKGPLLFAEKAFISGNRLPDRIQHVARQTLRKSRPRSEAALRRAQTRSRETVGHRLPTFFLSHLPAPAPPVLCRRWPFGCFFLTAMILAKSPLAGVRPGERRLQSLP
ncbi:MAG: hypothetical protein KGN36_11910, partial [Acidobacteriota bacterium]|nr:hypothetical protein [Acidobacteriota bacterium]